MVVVLEATTVLDSVVVHSDQVLASLFQTVTVIHLVLVDVKVAVGSHSLQVSEGDVVAATGVLLEDHSLQVLDLLVVVFSDGVLLVLDHALQVDGSVEVGLTEVDELDHSDQVVAGSVEVGFTEVLEVDHSLQVDGSVEVSLTGVEVVDHSLQVEVSAFAVVVSATGVVFGSEDSLDQLSHPSARTEPNRAAAAATVVAFILNSREFQRLRLVSWCTVVLAAAESKTNAREKSGAVVGKECGC